MILCIILQVTRLLTPSITLKMLKVNNKRIRFLTYKEVNKLLSKAKSKPYTKCALLSLYCGLRLGEIENLHYSDIDLQNKFTKQKDNT